MKVPEFHWALYYSEDTLEEVLSHVVFVVRVNAQYPTQINAFAVEKGRNVGYLAWFEFNRKPSKEEVAEYTPILRDMVIARFGLRYEEF